MFPKQAFPFTDSASQSPEGSSSPPKLEFQQHRQFPEWELQSFLPPLKSRRFSGQAQRSSPSEGKARLLHTPPMASKQTPACLPEHPRASVRSPIPNSKISRTDYSDPRQNSARNRRRANGAAGGSILGFGIWSGRRKQAFQFLKQGFQSLGNPGKIERGGRPTSPITESRSPQGKLDRFREP